MLNLSCQLALGCVKLEILSLSLSKTEAIYLEGTEVCPRRQSHLIKVIPHWNIHPLLGPLLVSWLKDGQICPSVGQEQLISWQVWYLSFCFQFRGVSWRGIDIQQSSARPQNVHNEKILEMINQYGAHCLRVILTNGFKGQARRQVKNVTKFSPCSTLPIHFASCTIR